MDRINWYFKRLVTFEDMNLSGDFTEDELHLLALDSYGYGIVDGTVDDLERALIVQQTPLAMAIDIVGPARARDRAGRKVPWTDLLTELNCAVDYLGASTTNDIIVAKGRWLSIYAGYDVTQANPQVDGNEQAVYFENYDGVEFYCVKGPLVDLEPDPDDPGTNRPVITIADPGDAFPVRPSSTESYPYIGDSILLGRIKLVYDGGVPAEITTALIRTQVDDGAGVAVSCREDWWRETYEHILTGGLPTTFIAGGAKEAIRKILAWFEANYSNFGGDDFWDLVGASDGQVYADLSALEAGAHPSVKDVVEQLITDLAQTGATAGSQKTGTKAITGGAYVETTASPLQTVLEVIVAAINLYVGAIITTFETQHSYEFGTHDSIIFGTQAAAGLHLLFEDGMPAGNAKNRLYIGPGVIWITSNARWDSGGSTWNYDTNLKAGVALRITADTLVGGELNFEYDLFKRLYWNGADAWATADWRYADNVSLHTYEATGGQEIQSAVPTKVVFDSAYWDVYGADRYAAGTFTADRFMRLKVDASVVTDISTTDPLVAYLILYKNAAPFILLDFKSYPLVVTDSDPAEQKQLPIAVWLHTHGSAQIELQKDDTLEVYLCVANGAGSVYVQEIIPDPGAPGTARVTFFDIAEVAR